MIIDEASQCSLPAVVPLLFRAKRALIIGDVMQLPHISPLPAQRDANPHTHDITSEWLDERQISVRRGLQLPRPRSERPGESSSSTSTADVTDIAAMSNERFYEVSSTVQPTPAGVRR